MAEGFLKTVLDIFEEESFKILTKYYKKKYGERIDLCFVKIKEDYIKFETTFISGYCDKEKIDSIRTLCSQSMLTRYALTLVNENGIVILVPSLSLIKFLGIRNFKKFLDNWKGQSFLADEIAIKYFIIGESK